MGGDYAHASQLAEVLGYGDGQGGAFFGIGGGAEFVEQDQRVGGGGAGDEVDVGDVGGEGREILLDGLIVADVGEDRVEDGVRRGRRGRGGRIGPLGRGVRRS